MKRAYRWYMSIVCKAMSINGKPVILWRLSQIEMFSKKNLDLTCI